MFGRTRSYGARHAQFSTHAAAAALLNTQTRRTHVAHSLKMQLISSSIIVDFPFGPRAGPRCREHRCSDPLDSLDYWHLSPRPTWKRTSEGVNRHVEELLVKTLRIPSCILDKHRDELSSRALLWGACIEDPVPRGIGLHDDLLQSAECSSAHARRVVVIKGYLIALHFRIG